RGGDLERHRGLALRLDLDRLARLHAERRAVHDLAVHQDVTVGHVLAGLQDGAAETGAQHERVETRLQVLDHDLTGQARLLASVLVHLEELLLAEHVLRAQTLLLAQTHRVVRLGAATGAAVLTGRVGTLLEVLDSLGREREAQLAAQSHLTARTGHRGHCVFLSCRTKEVTPGHGCPRGETAPGAGPADGADAVRRAFTGPRSQGLPVGTLSILPHVRPAPRRGTGVLAAQDAADALEPFGDLPLVAAVARLVVARAGDHVRQVLLRRHGVRPVVRVAVPLAVPERLRARVVRVTQVVRHG